MPLTPPSHPANPSAVEALVRELERLDPAARARPVPPHVRELLGRIAVDELYELVAMIRPDGTLLDANVPAMRAGGLPLETVVGKPVWDVPVFTGAAARDRLRDGLRHAAAGEFVRYEADFTVAASEKTIAVDVSLRPVRDAAETLAGLRRRGPVRARDRRVALGGRSGGLGRAAIGFEVLFD